MLIFSTFHILIVDVNDNKLDSTNVNIANKEIKLGVSEKKNYDRVRELQVVRWENIKIDDQHNVISAV